MKIWVNKISGDLQTINGLNHYIGMKTIEPDSIKELTYMPYIVGFLALAGVLAGLTGKKKLLAAWVILFVIAGIAGGIDFYMWEYDYGTNLNPEAAIKVPGMTYQPPLIGSKQLLNFTAHSYPDTAGIIMIASGILAVCVLFFENIRSRKLRVSKVKYETKVEKDSVKHNISRTVRHTALVQY
jgi:copper chaperone NosL